MEGHYWLTRVSGGVEEGDGECSALLVGFELARKIGGDEEQRLVRCTPWLHGLSRKLQCIMLIITLNLPFTVFRHWASEHESPFFFPVGAYSEEQRSRRGEGQVEGELGDLRKGLDSPKSAATG